MQQTQRALLTLREMILEGVLVSGERLWEPALARRIGVSRTPLREALVRLEHEGFIVAPEGSGYRVRVFDHDYFRDAIELRGTLEGMAARRAAERDHDEASLGAMDELVEGIAIIVDQPRLSHADFEQYMTLNAEFHQRLVALAECTLLAEELDRIAARPFASPSAFVMAQAILPRSRDILFIANDQHRCLCDAIRSGDGSRAEQLAREHAHIARRNLAVALQDHAFLDRISGAPMLRAALD
ncbi:GntR family transcriptional regulator [Kushneria sinocarnis]|uniref:GntR family transcriptional regulator n=1 Tax=Kushneria sinocarnis TaxID=595502 RepID=A0A420WWC4_9GAMM|nr:GntR family transcriptional regulator [Kushneria sinocarnis]RKR03414.1 GntR family transcriptional regulator [Kushneria sinocarnis]